jgi:monoamine oxidase
LRFQRPECREKLKGIGRVAVVGGGLAGLMAARRLVQHGITVTVYEARKEVGGRVLSNENFSVGRITEEGAELIGSFHTTWLGLAREYGLAMVSRMDPDLYQREGLSVKLTLDKPLSRVEFNDLTAKMNAVLKKIALLAKGIRDPSRPWKQARLKTFDNMTVQQALHRVFGLAERKSGNKDERLWKMLEFKLVNDEVGPLDEMNFLGLLCKVRGGQGERFGEGLRPILMGYWDELEIFRCADGCQLLAKKMAEEIRQKKDCLVNVNTKVRVINILKDKVRLNWVPVRGGKPDAGPGQQEEFTFVILAIPPSVWGGVHITVDDRKVDPSDKVGPLQMNGAVKFFSDVKDRFWIRKAAAPYGGSMKIGQVWEGTDNQTRVLRREQGIVLSVFAGPIHPGRRVPTEKEFTDGLKELYPDYDLTPVTGNVNRTLLSNWPKEAFIETGYWTPKKGEIFKAGELLTRPFYHDRLLFAGEHTQMDFFGYMEGALRSGERAAETLMLLSCGLLAKPASTSTGRPSQKPAPKSTPPPVPRATPARETEAVEREDAESPFLARNLFASEAREDWEPRAEALAAESPFAGALEERSSTLDGQQLADEQMTDELEREEEMEAEAAREPQEDDTPHSEQTEHESLDEEDAAFREDALVDQTEAGFAPVDEFEEWADFDSVGDTESEWVAAADEEIPDWAADVDPFPAEPIVAFNVNDRRMVEAFDPIRVSTVSHLCAALVDLTGNTAMPPYAGLNDEEMIYAGSLPKICAMYAAFALRSRVQSFVDAAAAHGAPAVPPGIIREIEKAWKPKLRALFPTRSTRSFGNNQDVTFPRLDQILTFSPDGKVDFARAVPPLSDARIDAIRDKGAPEGRFHDWMRSMMRWSNNAAAGKCILALGYFYLNGALARAGLFDAATSSGLWLAADFQGHDWVKSDAERRANAGGQPLAPRWAAAQRRRKSNITATAAQVARFMTLLARNTLVDEAASRDMRALMNVKAGGVSYAHAALQRVGRASTTFAAKIGFGDDSFSHDCAIVERTVGGKRLRYVAVGLGSAPQRQRADLRDLFVLLDGAIVARNK